MGNYHSCRALRLVPLVSALSAARGVDPVPYPCRRYPGGTGAKSWVKARVREPRPFVIWLENTRQVPVTQFYALKRKERAKLVHEQLAQAQDIPSFYANTGRRRRGLLSRQVTPCLPPAGRYSLRAAVAASPLGHNRGAAGVGDGGDGQSPGAGHALAAGSHRRHADLRLLVTVACWLTQRLCGPLSPPGEEAQDIKNGCLKRNNVDFSGIRPHILKSCHAFSFHRCGENDTL